jgi:hypothetical protein
MTHPTALRGRTTRTTAIKAVDDVQRLGSRGVVRVVAAIFLWPLLHRLYPAYVEARRHLLEWRRRQRIEGDMTRLQERIPDIVSVGRASPRLGPAPTMDQLGSATIEDGVPIAEIDQDGYFTRRGEPVADLPAPPDGGRPMARRRFQLALTIHDGLLAVRKDFRGDRFAFVHEVEMADALQRAGVKVPAILDIDGAATAVTFDFIPGEVVREKLAVGGARLRDRDAIGEPRSRLGRRRQGKSRIAQGRRVARALLRPELIEQILAQVEKAHRAGIILHDIKYGNIVLAGEAEEPHLFDFEHARSYPGWGKLANRMLRDTDRVKFNRLFGPYALTEKRVRQMARTNGLGTLYAPILLEGGIRFGAIWNTDVGDARWRYLLGRNLPHMGGARILDLGANNGFNAIQMLRAGAREVVAIEVNAEAIEQGRQVARLFEWADNESYNLHWIHESMAALPFLELGSFDFVTALCSIYYLNDDDIAAVIRHSSSITDTFVLQCNLDRRIARSDPRTFEKASLEYAQRVLVENGFPILSTVEPPGYSRPLVVGRAAEASD